MKRLQIYKLPKILIIQLKRFYSKKTGGSAGYFSAVSHFLSQEKIPDLVEFPIEGLDMSKYSISSEPNQIYDLYGVSNHYGSLHGGHYTAFGLNPVQKKWYHFNDSSVSSVSNLKEIVSQGAYLLFYRKRE